MRTEFIWHALLATVGCLPWYPIRTIEVRQVNGEYELTPRTCDGKPIGVSSITVRSSSGKFICELSGYMSEPWIYGKKVPGLKLWPEQCEPLQPGSRYEIRGEGIQIIEIEPSGEPRVIESRCD